MSDKLSCPYTDHHEDTRKDRENDTCRQYGMGLAWAVNFDHDFFDKQYQYTALRERYLKAQGEFYKWDDVLSKERKICPITRFPTEVKWTSPSALQYILQKSVDWERISKILPYKS